MVFNREINAFPWVSIIAIAFSVNNLKKHLLEIQTPNFKTSGLGMYESVHAKYWMMRHPSYLLAPRSDIIYIQSTTVPKDRKILKTQEDHWS